MPRVKETKAKAPGARAKSPSRGRRGDKGRGPAEAADDEAVAANATDELQDELDPESDGDFDGSAASAETEPEADEALADEDLDDGDDFDGDEDGEDLSAAEKLLGDKQGNARELAIRRAIEERREARRLKEDLDYLDLDD